MKHRARNLENIYHQFIKGTELDQKIGLGEAAACLIHHGLIEMLDMTHYFETEKMRSIEPKMFRSIVLSYLRKCALEKE